MSPKHFCASSYHFRDITIFKLLTFKSWSRSQSSIFAITPVDGKCQNLQMSLTHFCADSCRFIDIKKISLLTFRKQVNVTKCNFRMMPFNCVYQLNIPHYTFLPQLSPLRRYKHFTIVTLEIQVKATSYNIQL